VAGAAHSLSFAVTPPRFVLSDERAACRDVDPELFFPPSGDDGRLAKAVCHRCPLRASCASWALEQDTTLAGVWGGLSTRDRMQHRRRART
jgi:WhiB family transcriptional regulator, redox-sensing transcriptional regulator